MLEVTKSTMKSQSRVLWLASLLHPLTRLPVCSTRAEVSEVDSEVSEGLGEAEHDDIVREDAGFELD